MDALGDNRRSEGRWFRKAEPGAADHGWDDRNLGRTNGEGEPHWGLSSDSGSTLQSWARHCSEYNRSYSGSPWPGTGTGARSKDNMEGVPEPTWELDCSRRFLHR